MPKDPVKEHILEKVDIVEIISSYSKLLRKGNRFFGLCPFHKEKSPSFSVHPERGYFHCFGCGKSGNSIDFIMDAENLTYGEARRYLATKLGIPIVSHTGEKRDHEEIDRYQVMDLAAQLYSQAIQKNTFAMEYAKNRGLSDAHIHQFSLGYAPDGWDNLCRAMKQKNIPDTVLTELGLIIPRKEGSGFYDRFRHRLMFPIRNTLSRVIAFGGRALDPKDNAKYLNSNETSLFSKSKVLYLLDQAKNVLKDKGAILVEGYMDAITLHVYGFTQAVASLGTSLTKEHVNTLRRYTTDFTLLYDGDNAGINAAVRGVDIFLEMGYSPKVALLPMGVDPDDFVKKEGPEAMQQLLNSAIDGFTFYLQQLMKKHDSSTARGKSDIVKNLVPLFEKVMEPIMLKEFIQITASQIGTDITTLERSIEKKLNKETTEVSQTTNTPAITSPDKPLESANRVLKESLLRLLALHRGLISIETPDAMNPVKTVFLPDELKLVDEYLEKTSKEQTPGNRILRLLMDMPSANDLKKQAVKLDQLFSGSDLFSIFIRVTEQVPMPNSQKSIDKMKIEVLVEMLKEMQKLKQREIFKTAAQDPLAAQQALNDLFLNKNGAR